MLLFQNREISVPSLLRKSMDFYEVSDAKEDASSKFKVMRQLSKNMAIIKKVKLKILQCYCNLYFNSSIWIPIKLSNLQILKT